MNNETRKELEGIITRLEEIKDDEEQKLENLIEYFPDTEKTDLQQQAFDALESAIDSLNEAIE